MVGTTGRLRFLDCACSFKLATSLKNNATFFASELRMNSGPTCCNVATEEDNSIYYSSTTRNTRTNPIGRSVYVPRLQLLSPYFHVVEIDDWTLVVMEDIRIFYCPLCMICRVRGYYRYRECRYCRIWSCCADMQSKRLTSAFLSYLVVYLWSRLHHQYRHWEAPESVVGSQKLPLSKGLFVSLEIAVQTAKAVLAEH